MNSRNVETIFRYWTLNHSLPQNCCLGIAAFLVFYLPDGSEDNRFFRLRESEKFFFKDEHTNFLCTTLTPILTHPEKTSTIISQIFSYEAIFSRDLNEIPGLINRVSELFSAIRHKGMRNVLKDLQS